jgi:hypothetical protein
MPFDYFESRNLRARLPSGRESRRAYHARMVVDRLLGVTPTEVVS